MHLTIPGAVWNRCGAKFALATSSSESLVTEAACLIYSIIWVFFPTLEVEKTNKCLMSTFHLHLPLLASFHTDPLALWTENDPRGTMNLWTKVLPQATTKSMIDIHMLPPQRTGSTSLGFDNICPLVQLITNNKICQKMDFWDLRYQIFLEFRWLKFSPEKRIILLDERDSILYQQVLNEVNNKVRSYKKNKIGPYLFVKINKWHTLKQNFRDDDSPAIFN